MKRLFAAALIFFIIFPFFAIADVIILKNGKQIKSEEVWEEGNQVKCYLFGQIVGYPKETVKQIKSEEGEATSESESEGNLLGSREKAEADLKKALKNGSIPNFLGEEREIEIRMNAYDMLLSLPQNDLKELISEYYPDFSSILKEHRLKSAKATSPKPKKAVRKIYRSKSPMDKCFDRCKKGPSYSVGPCNRMCIETYGVKK